MTTKATPIRTREKPQVQKQRILEAAVDVFAHSSISDATIGEIAAAAKVSRTLLYHYFPSKTEIIEALQFQAIVDIEQLVLSIRDHGGSTQTQIAALVDGYHEVLTGRPSIVNILSCQTAEPLEGQPTPLRQELHKLRRSLVEWMEELEPAVRKDIKVDELLLVGLGALFVWFFPTPLAEVLGARPGTRGTALQAHKEAVTKMLIDGLCGCPDHK
ncbi:MAG: TetR/AcrR family transcriptional regulator [Ferrimicrobium sp.]